MSDTDPIDPDDISIDELFGVEQTAEARLTVKVSYSALHEGRPWYPHAEYGDAPRIVQYEDEDGEIQTVIESEMDLRNRVVSTALRALEETHSAAVQYFANQSANRSKETN